MGTVYEALDLHTDTRVAVKALYPDRVTNETLRRFRREAHAAQAARHPNLCTVHCFGVHAGTPYIVMERLEGETLRSRIKRSGVLTVADTVAIGIKLLDALTAVHAAKILHRDVKPGNVFVTTPLGATPEIKLIDFGLARFLSNVGVDDTSITRTGATPGTPAYLSPEQILGASDLDERVDVWGAALTMFEVLTGRHGFGGAVGNQEALLQEILVAPIQPISEIRNDVPLAIETVLSKALSKRREERYATAQAFRIELVDAWARHRFDGVRRGALVAAGLVTTESDTPPTSSKRLLQ